MRLAVAALREKLDKLHPQIASIKESADRHRRLADQESRELWALHDQVKDIEAAIKKLTEGP